MRWLECTATYGSVLEGRPGPELNAHVLAQHTERARRKMDHVTLRVLKPAPSPAGLLPRVTCLAGLEASTLVERGESDMGSHLKVRFFLDALPTGALFPSEVLGVVDWARHAENFDL